MRERGFTAPGRTGNQINREFRKTATKHLIQSRDTGRQTVAGDQTAIFEDYLLRIIFFGGCVAVVNYLEMRLFPRLRYVCCVGRYFFAVVLFLLLNLLVVSNIAWVGHMDPLWRL